MNKDFFTTKEIARIVVGISAIAMTVVEEGTENKKVLIAGATQFAPAGAIALDLEDSKTIENIADYTAKGGVIYIAANVIGKFMKGQKKPTTIIAGLAVFAYTAAELYEILKDDEEDNTGETPPVDEGGEA